MTIVDIDDRPGPLRSPTLELGDDVTPLVSVRRWAGGELADLVDDDLDDCVLVVTELVANAYDHGHAPRRVRLRRSSEPCVVRIEVDDVSSERPTLGRSRLGPHRGRGLVLVANLSDDWGVDHHPHGKTVWAEIPCALAAR